MEKKLEENLNDGFILVEYPTRGKIRYHSLDSTLEIQQKMKDIDPSRGDWDDPLAYFEAYRKTDKKIILSEALRKGNFEDEANYDLFMNGEFYLDETYF